MTSWSLRQICFSFWFILYIHINTIFLLNCNLSGRSLQLSTTVTRIEKLENGIHLVGIYGVLGESAFISGVARHRALVSHLVLSQDFISISISIFSCSCLVEISRIGVIKCLVLNLCTCITSSSLSRMRSLDAVNRFCILFNILKI